MDSSEEMDKGDGNSVRRTREDGSEYVRLVISTDQRVAEADTAVLPQSSEKLKSLVWWIKALTLCFLIIILSLLFFKWGVPFLFEKVN